ncbi:unnamed protein product [Mytilus edulis]|uniref:Uncharacterized protein n=1 Tax=Mytilus edulis TaxID=6550 RepID=A0A8S3PRE4_MYTED|nr:unnamed protein product [Mytilus edulis]
MALPFLPHSDIRPAFNTLKERANSQELKELVVYISSTWFEGRYWCPRTWSIFQHSIRTNNDVEGWHTRINSGKSNVIFYFLILMRGAEIVDLTLRLVYEEQVLGHQRRRLKDLEGQIDQFWKEGDQFRPTFQRLGEMRSHFTEVPFLLLTATCTDAILKSITKKLHIDAPTIESISPDRSVTTLGKLYRDILGELRVLFTGEHVILYYNTGKKWEGQWRDGKFSVAYYFVTRTSLIHVNEDMRKIIMEEKQEDKLNVALEMRQREIHETIKLPRIKSFSLNRVVTVRGYERSGKRNRMAFRTLHVTNRFVTQLERTVTYCEGPYLDQKDTCFVYVFAGSANFPNSWNLIPVIYRDNPYICLDVESFPLDSAEDTSGFDDDNISEVHISSIEGEEYRIESLPIPPRQRIKH